MSSLVFDHYVLTTVLTVLWSLECIDVKTLQKIFFIKFKYVWMYLRKDHSNSLLIDWYSSITKFSHIQMLMYAYFLCYLSQFYSTIIIISETFSIVLLLLFIGSFLCTKACIFVLTHLNSATQFATVVYGEDFV